MGFVVGQQEREVAMCLGMEGHQMHHHTWQKLVAMILLGEGRMREVGPLHLSHELQLLSQPIEVNHHLPLVLVPLGGLLLREIPMRCWVVGREMMSITTQPQEQVLLVPNGRVCVFFKLAVVSDSFSYSGGKY